MTGNLNPFGKSRKPCAARLTRLTAGERLQRKKQKPRLGRGFRKRQSDGCYLGAVDESAVDFLLFLLWLFL